MTSLTDTFPTDLDAPGKWAFEASYRVHDGYGRVRGEGTSIPEAIENGFAKNHDPDIEEACSDEDWELDWLSFNGERISKSAATALGEAEKALLGVQNFGDTPVMAAAVRAFQEAHAARQRVKSLEKALLSLLVERNTLEKALLSLLVERNTLEKALLSLLVERNNR